MHAQYHAPGPGQTVLQANRFVAPKVHNLHTKPLLHRAPLHRSPLRSARPAPRPPCAASLCAAPPSAAPPPRPLRAQSCCAQRPSVIIMDHHEGSIWPPSLHPSGPLSTQGARLHLHAASAKNMPMLCRRRSPQCMSSSWAHVHARSRHLFVSVPLEICSGSWGAGRKQVPLFCVPVLMPAHLLCRAVCACISPWACGSGC